MPYMVAEDDKGDWCVYKQNADKSKGKMMFNHGKDKEKAMAQMRALYASESKQNAAGVSTVSHAGKDYLVVPGVPVREGVMKNYFVPAKEIIKSIPGWNGTPLTLYHPKQNNGSARVPDPDAPIIGYFYNAHWDQTGKRMIGDYWFDVAEANKYEDGQKIISMIEQNQMVETSTGYWSEDLKTPGVFNSRAYDITHINLLPDHIAVLPRQIGACSLKDGCGVNRNAVHQNCDCSTCPVAMPAQNEMMVEYKAGYLPTSILYPYSFNKGSRTAEELAAMRQYFQDNGITKPVFILWCDEEIKILDGNHRVAMAYELGYTQVPVKIVDDEGNPIDPEVIYRKYQHEEDQSFLGANPSGAPAIQNTNQPRQSKAALNTKPSKRSHKMDLKELLAQLGERGVQVSANAEGTEFSIEETPPNGVNSNSLSAEDVTALKQLAQNAQALTGLGDIATLAKEARARTEAEKATLIMTIKANEANQLTDEELNKMELGTLVKIAGAVNVNYAGTLGGQSLFQNGDVPVLMPAPAMLTAKKQEV